MSYSATQWENDSISRHVDPEDFNYEDFDNLPCYFNEKTGRWHDSNTNLIVSDSKAFSLNDAECERQVSR